MANPSYRAGTEPALAYLTCKPLLVKRDQSKRRALKTRGIASIAFCAIMGCGPYYTEVDDEIAPTFLVMKWLDGEGRQDKGELWLAIGSTEECLRGQGEARIVPVDTRRTSAQSIPCSELMLATMDELPEDTRILGEAVPEVLESPGQWSEAPNLQLHDRGIRYVIQYNHRYARILAESYGNRYGTDTEHVYEVIELSTSSHRIRTVRSKRREVALERLPEM